jgi:hypothetical protein
VRSLLQRTIIVLIALPPSPDIFLEQQPLPMANFDKLRVDQLFCHELDKFVRLRSFFVVENGAVALEMRHLSLHPLFPIRLLGVGSLLDEAPPHRFYVLFDLFGLLFYRRLVGSDLVFCLLTGLNPDDPLDHLFEVQEPFELSRVAHKKLELNWRTRLLDPGFQTGYLSVV